jgi:glyoxylase-like metal-dependent hydrolase (beta-lactamase superfamily II)
MTTTNDNIHARGIFTVAGIIALLSLAAGAYAQDGALSLKVITSSPGSLNTKFTLIQGETEAVLVDVPFLRSDAYRLVADILDSGKTLTTIIVTHAHPDHYFSLDVLRDAFPNARAIAAPVVVADVWTSFPARLAFWQPQIGAQAPRYPMIPTAFDETSFELEGHRIEILGPFTGDAPNSTAVYVPDLDAVIAGDIVFNQVHVYAGGKAERAAWVATLDRLLALEPEIVVAGHTKANLPNTRAGLEYTRGYLLRFEQAIAEAKDAPELMAIMRGAYPDAIDFQGDFILTTTATAAMREKNGE